MRRNEPCLIADILPKVIEVGNMAEQLTYMKVRRAWEQIMPEQLQQYISSIEVKDHVLTAHISSPALRNELFNNRRKIVEQINSLSSPGAIRQLILMS